MNKSVTEIIFNCYDWHEIDDIIMRASSLIKQGYRTDIIQLHPENQRMSCSAFYEPDGPLFAIHFKNNK